MAFTLHAQHPSRCSVLSSDLLRLTYPACTADKAQTTSEVGLLMPDFLRDCAGADSMLKRP